MLTDKEAIQLLQNLRKDPVRAIERLFHCSLWDKQAEIAKSVLLWLNRITAVRSCHDSGKSFDVARIALLYLIINEDSLVITTAPSWTQVKEILWREFRSAYVKVTEIVIGGKLLDTQLEFGETWFAIGIATKKEGQSSEVAERMLGFHSSTGKILIVVDEGSGVEEPIWGSIDGLMTSEYAQLLAIGNPYRKTGSFAKLFTTKRVYKIHIQDTDIPNIKENRVVIPGLMSPTYPQRMAEKYGIDSNLYLVKVKGELPKSETDTLISLDDLEKAFERTVEPEGKKKLGVDVARYGPNFTALVVRQGKKILSKEKHPQTSVPDTVALVKKRMEAEGILAEDVDIDDGGLGGGVVDILQADPSGNYKVNGINAQSDAEDKEHFFNIRAENAWSMKKWIKTADIPRDDDFLEVANIKYKWRSDKKGQLQLESKIDMTKRGLDSPDVFDALALTFSGSNPDPFPGGKKTDEQKAGSRPITADLKKKKF